MKISIAFFLCTIIYCNHISNAANTLNYVSGIEYVNSKFRCGQILCPNTTYQCSVRRRSYLQNSRIQIVSNCSNRQGKSIWHLIRNYTNPNPGAVVKTFSAANLHGNAVDCNTCSTLEEARKTARNTMAENMALMKFEMKTDDVSTTSLSNEIKKEMNQEGETSSGSSLGSNNNSSMMAYNNNHTMGAFGVGSTNASAYGLANSPSNYSSSASSSVHYGNLTNLSGNTAAAPNNPVGSTMTNTTIVSGVVIANTTATQRNHTIVTNGPMIGAAPVVVFGSIPPLVSIASANKTSTPVVGSTLNNNNTST